MVARSNAVPPTLYLEDETAWLELSAQLIREGRLNDLDLANLAEYLTDMGKRDRREVVTRLALLIAHILKYTHQPERRSRSWRKTILTQQQQLQSIFESRTLRNHAEATLPRAYDRAVALAAADTGLDRETFPTLCPYTLADLEQFDAVSA
jgi:Domain of unknown function DUF29